VSGRAARLFAVKDRQTDSARAFEAKVVTLLTRPACPPASACEFVRPFFLLLSVSPRTQVSTTFPVMALCKAEITRHGHTRPWAINMGLDYGGPCDPGILTRIHRIWTSS
jgi:hypothetical protein